MVGIQAWTWESPTRLNWDAKTILRQPVRSVSIEGLQEALKCAFWQVALWTPKTLGGELAFDDRWPKDNPLQAFLLRAEQEAGQRVNLPALAPSK